MASPSLGCGEFCESIFALGSSVHQKCSNYALTNLLFGLCKSVRIIDLLLSCPSPHPGAPSCPSTLEVLQTKERTQTLYYFCYFHLRFVVESIKELGVHHMVLELWYNSIHLLGNSDGTKKDP